MNGAAHHDGAVADARFDRSESSLPDARMPGAADRTMDAADSESGPPDASKQPSCNPDAPFGDPVALRILNTDRPEEGIWVMPDDLTAYFSRNTEVRDEVRDVNQYDIYRATRSDPLAEFQHVTLLPDPVNTLLLSEQGPTLSANGLIMFYYSSKSPGDHDIFVSIRKSPSSEFPLGSPVPAINSTPVGKIPGDESDPFLTSDGKELYFASNRNGTSDIFVARVDSFGNALTPVEIKSVNSSGSDGSPVVTSDGLEMYFDRDGDIWLARRPSSKDYSFSVVGPVDHLNDSKANDSSEALSPDGCTLYFTSNRVSDRSYDLYRATKP